MLKLHNSNEFMYFSEQIPVFLPAKTLTSYMPVYFEVACQCIFNLHARIFLFPYLKDTHLNDQIIVLLHARSGNKLGMIYLFERLH